MSDVITNAHSSVTTIVNGAAIVHVKKTGEYESHNSNITTLNTPSGTLNTRLKTRFDDVRYYTGDSATDT
jgi:hypothetical protein